MPNKYRMLLVLVLLVTTAVLFKYFRKPENSLFNLNVGISETAEDSQAYPDKSLLGRPVYTFADESKVAGGTIERTLSPVFLIKKSIDKEGVMTVLAHAAVESDNIGQVDLELKVFPIPLILGEENMDPLDYYKNLELGTDATYALTLLMPNEADWAVNAGKICGEVKQCGMQPDPGLENESRYPDISQVLYEVKNSGIDPNKHLLLSALYKLRNN